MRIIRTLQHWISLALTFRSDMSEIYERSKFSSDHVATPRYVVENIYKLIKVEQFKSIWFPFNHYDSEFKLKADELELQYKATHLFDDLGNDFFTTEPPMNCDLMISNPPFSIQNEIIKHSFELVEKGMIGAFALLLPLATLETEIRGDMYNKNRDRLSIIVFKKRIKFKGHTQVFNRGCCWICYNIDGLEPFSWI